MSKHNTTNSDYHQLLRVWQLLYSIYYYSNLFINKVLIVLIYFIILTKLDQYKSALLSVIYIKDSKLNMLNHEYLLHVTLHNFLSIVPKKEIEMNHLYPLLSEVVTDGR